ncbi:ATP-dependent DNA helicase [Cutibacterium acnes JCM 18918]|nr:ATP-dependent DNA helicase [Cutibacterium acnes JCM 18918]
MCVMHGWDGLQARVLADDAGTVLVMGGPGTGRTSYVSKLRRGTLPLGDGCLKSWCWHRPDRRPRRYAQRLFVDSEVLT